MESMYKSGRVFVQDAPVGSAAWRMLQQMDQDDHSSLLSYEELIDLMAVECDGMSGASLAGVARAAASRALERAVTDFAGHIATTDAEDEVQNSINDCLVTQEDFERACDDVFESAKAEEYEEEGRKPQAKRKEDATDDTNDGHDIAASSGDGADTDIATSVDKVNQHGTKSLNEEKVPTESNSSVSEHESITEYFRAGVEIPADWTSGRGDERGSGKYGSLRDLLPERKTRWLKLDQFGRRVEDTDTTRSN